MLDKNLIGIEPDFSKNSNYNPKANIGQVKFGADAPVLEVELNELQQVQDKAREDLIRSMIPSGFTKPVKIDFYHDKNSSNAMYTLEDAEAYVNGIRIFIPKGTKIDLGDSPEKETREDLVFLEVWKEEVKATSTLNEYGGEGQENIPNNLIDPRVGEETSHRIVNRWRIRCAQDVDFEFKGDSSTTTNCSDTYIGWIDDRKFSKVYAKGADPLIGLPTNINGIEIFRSANSNWNGSSPINDTGLWIAGLKNQKQSINRFKTIDGLVYAIPMFRLHRRPNQGFSTGDYANISPLADPTKLTNLLQNEKLSSVATGEVECVVAGATMYNLVTGAPSLAVQHSDKITGKVNGDSVTIKRAVAGDSGFIYVGVPINLSSLEFNTDYTVVFNASGKAECEDAYLNIMTGASQEDVAGAKFTRKVGLNVVHVKTYKNPKSLTGQILYIGVNSYSGRDTLPNLQDEMTLGNFMLLKGKIEEKDIPKYFKGFKSVGDYSVKLDRFVSWGAEVVNGTAQDNIATISVKLTNPYVRVVPVNLNGEEIVDANVAFKLLGTSDRELGWNSCPNVMHISNYSEAKQVRVFCNSIAKSNKISGFNIYTGNNIIIKSVIDDKNESVMEMQLNEPLRGIPNSDVRDLAFGDGRVFRRIAKGVLDANSNWINAVMTSTDGNYLIFQAIVSNIARTRILSTYNYVDIMGDDNSKSHNKEYLGLYKGFNQTNEWLYLSIKKSKLSSENLDGLKAYLRTNPIEYYYDKKEMALENPILPNGVVDYNDFSGSITRNIGILKNPKTLNWGLDTGISQSANLMRFTVEIADKRPLRDDNNEYGDDVCCQSIPTIRWSSGESRLPRIWCWYKKSIYIDVNASTIGVNFTSDSDSTKITKFKEWLGRQGVIYYEKENPSVDKYNMDFANIKGNLVFNNDSTAKIECDSLIQPSITLEHRAELNLDLFADKCYVITESTIPPSTLEVNGQTSSTGSLELNLDNNMKKAPVKLIGRTLRNLIKDGRGTFVIDKSANKQSRIYQFKPIYNLQVGKRYVGYVKLDNIENAEFGLRIYGSGVDYTSAGAYFSIGKNTGICKFTWDTSIAPESIKEFQTIGIYIENTDFDNNGKATFSDFMLFEENTDLTYVDEYFKGIKSFGEIELEGNKINVLSCGKNFFNANLFSEKINSKGELEFKAEGNTRINSHFVICAKDDPSSTKVLVASSLDSKRFITLNQEKYYLQFGLNGDKKDDKVWKEIILPRNTTCFFSADIIVENNNTVKFKDIQIEIGTSKTKYEEYKGSKRVILLEEPIHNENIAYEDKGQIKVKKVMSQYTFTGCENITKWADSPNACWFTIRNNFRMNYGTNNSGTELLCDNFKSYNHGEFSAQTSINNSLIGITAFEDYFTIRIEKSKLATQDVEGFKDWLKANPTKVIFKLAEPKIEVIKSIFSYNDHIVADFKGQVGYKRTSDSGLDCGVLTLSPTNVNTNWITGDIRLCDYSYSYGNIQDLVGVPLRLGAGYSYSTEHNFKILEVVSDTKAIVQNIGRNLPANLSRSFFPSFVCSTAQSEFTTGDLQKSVSLTGTDYSNLLEKLVCEHLY